MAAFVKNLLYDVLSAKWEDVRENKLSIITFNYDRTLEHFLFTSLKHSYNKSDDEIAQAFSNIPIIHVHGWLGELPWQGAIGKAYTPIFSEFETIRKNPKSTEARSVAKDISLSAMWSSVQINIVSEEAQPQIEDFTKAHELLKQAERIYFLGFGYHPTNLERLGLLNLNIADFTLHRNSDTKLIPLRGSALGLGSAEIEAIQNRWKILLMDNTSNALQFLKEYADLS